MKTLPKVGDTVYSIVPREAIVVALDPGKPWSVGLRFTNDETQELWWSLPDSLEPEPPEWLKELAAR